MERGPEQSSQTPALAAARRRLAARALIPVALTVGFYVLALAFAAALVIAPMYLAIAHDVPPYALLWLLTYPAAWFIVRAVFTPTGTFEQPGVPLERTGHPRLFALIDEVARAVGEPPPDQVRAVWGDVAAVYEERARLMRRGPRVMLLGIGLIQCVTTWNLRSMLAHELAHYAAGDTRLGRIETHLHVRFDRVIRALEDHVLPLRLPFVWYGRIVQRVSARIQRGEEYVADAVAVWTYGREAARGALRGGTTAAWFDAYWDAEVAPVLDAGYLPPIAEGFGRYVAGEPVTSLTKGAWQEEVAQTQVDPYSRHPLTRSRWERAEAPELDPVAVHDSAPAIELLGAVHRVERALLEATESGERVAALRPIAWDDVGKAVWAEIWRSQASPAAVDLRQASVGSLPRLIAQAKAAASPPAEVPPPEVVLIGARICAALSAAGWAIDARPGVEVTATAGGRALQPFRAVIDLWTGKLDVAEWSRTCAEAGIEGLVLSADGQDPTHAARTSTAPPAGELRLAADRKSRVPTALGMILVGGIGALITLMLVAMAFLADMPLGGTLFCLAVAAGLATMLSWFILVHVRSVLRPASVRLEPDCLVVDHPAIFKEPLRVSAGAVRMVTVDDGDDGQRKDRRFPVRGGSWAWADGPDAALGWLWTREEGSIVPYLGVLAGRPNGAMLFETPVAAPPLRRESEHGPLKGEALAGLLMTFEDPSTAAQVLGRVAREVTAEDAERLEAAFSRR